MQASLVTATALFATTLGISVKKINAVTGLGPSSLIDAKGRLPDHLVALIWNLIDEARPNEALPLKMAAIAPDTYFGVLAHAWRHSEGAQAALDLFVRFHRTLADRLHVEVERNDKTTTIHFSHPSDSIDQGCGSEAGAAAVSSFSRKHFADGALIGVHFAFGPHGPLEAYEEFFRAPVEFNTGRTELILKTKLLSVSKQPVDTELSQYLFQYLEEVSTSLRREGEGKFLLRVRRAIEENAQHADYSIQGLADRLHLSVRTMQRNAKKGGVRLADVLNEARMTHARKLLASQELNVGEVAFLVGYSDLRAFARAFKRYSGKTPTEFMKSSTWAEK